MLLLLPFKENKNKGLRTVFKVNQLLSVLYWTLIFMKKKLYLPKATTTWCRGARTDVHLIFVSILFSLSLSFHIHVYHPFPGFPFSVNYRTTGNSMWDLSQCTMFSIIDKIKRIVKLITFSKLSLSNHSFVRIELLIESGLRYRSRNKKFIYTFSPHRITCKGPWRERNLQNTLSSMLSIVELPYHMSDQKKPRNKNVCK